jgi:hypothetical protein
MGWGLVAVLLLATPAFAAGRKPTEFAGVKEMSEEELAAAKEKSKNPLNAFSEKMEEKPQDFPWRAAGLGLICILVAAPFGLKSYRDMTRPTAQSKSFAGRTHQAD